MATLNPPIIAGRNGGHGFGPEGSPDYAGRLRRARVGLAVALAPIVMLFVSFTSAYIVRQGLPTLDEHTNQYVRDWLTIPLPVALLIVNTILLVASSITAEFSRRQLARSMRLSALDAVPGVAAEEGRAFPWLPVTVMLGLAFLAGQWMAWRELAARGFYLATNASTSFIYLLTGAHAVHLAGGLLVLLYALASNVLRKPLESRYIVVDTAAWYWHFMALLWIYIFALLEFAR